MNNITVANKHAGLATRHLVLAEQILEPELLTIGGVIADVAAVAGELRDLASGQASVEDLPRAGLPAWAVEVTIKWRAERDRRGWGRAA